MSHIKVFSLQCAVQKYEWGKIGIDSEVAQLAYGSCQNFQLIDDKPYAELWMGTHPSGPSIVSSDDNYDGMPLVDWIRRFPESLGRSVQEQFGPTLPYLLKVLSVNKALSIQVHPDKSLAEKLYVEQPKLYPDSNHKPEIAVALTRFEALCGFRPFREIQTHLTEVPEFRNVVGEESTLGLLQIPGANEAETKEALKQSFTEFMNCPADRLDEQLTKYVKRLKENKKSSKLEDLFIRIHDQFPGDIGCFAVFFFNYVIMEPGESIFLAAGEPHCYLNGNCVECMACSDNVIRAGLTPKYKDVARLCDTLTYNCKTAKEQIFQSMASSCPYTKVYKPPVSDFAVLRIELPEDTAQYSINSLSSCSILIIIQGEATARNATTKEISIGRGSVLFISAGESVELLLSSPGMLLFQAYCPYC